MINDCILLVILILFISIYFYKPELLGIEHFVDYTPKIKVGETVVWTYIEKPYRGNPSKTLFSHNYDVDIPYYLKICTLIMEKACRSNIKLIVLTPENICDYLDDFPIIMNITSQYSLKYRVDLLGAYILEKYGGIWLSPGTIIYKPEFYYDIFKLLKDVDLVTFGSDESIINNCSLEYHPDNLVIAANKNNMLISLYKIVLKRQQVKYQLPPDAINRILDEEVKDLIDTNRFNMAQDNNIGVYALGEAFRLARIKELPFSHYNLGCLYDGRKNRYNKYITIKDLLSTTEVAFANRDKLLFISVPYSDLYEFSDFLWFYNLSEQQFHESQINIVKYVKESITRVQY
tara:strand:- start:528 stop:1565 length:1038 start_codon:yes stop_codon:yes gene_type:complete